MKNVFTLLNILLLIFLFVVTEGVAEEKEDPSEKAEEGDPDLQTIIIHADSTKLLNKNFDDLEDSGWLENWNVPLIIANSDNGAKDEEVEKVQNSVKFMPGRFKNKKAVIHMREDSRTDGEAAEKSVVDSWIVGDKEAETGLKQEKPSRKNSVEKTKESEEKQEEAKKISGPEDMEKDNNMHTIVIHSDTDEAQRRYFDELEDSKAMDNWLVPRIITNGHNKTKRKQIKKFKKKEHMSFRGRFTNKQAVIHVRDETVLKRRREETNQRKEDEGLDLREAYDVAMFFNNTLGTLEYYWMHLASENLTDDDKWDAGRFLPWDFTLKTFVKKPNATYVYYETTQDDKTVYLSQKLDETRSFDTQWKDVQMNSLKDMDLTVTEYANTPSSKPVLMGFWDSTCESMDWALEIKLNHPQNLAHVCLLHHLRRSRFKFFAPPDAKDRDCEKYPLNCTVEIDDVSMNGIRFHSLMTVDGSEYHEAKHKRNIITPIFFSSAGGYERLVVGYFILKPEETSKFNIFKGFLYADALVAILSFGIIMTALIWLSGHTLRQTMFYMFAAVFEQGQRVPINAHDHGGRAFFGKVICFLWLLSWLILRQFLSGALVSNLTREEPPNSPSNQDCLINFLRDEGTVLIEPLKRDENDWFQGSRNKSNNTGKCWKKDFITHVFNKNMKENELFPELKLMACIKSAAESTSSSCENFHNISIPFAFSYISTERRLETMKKLAKLVDKGIFVSTSNIDTPFVKPNFFAPYDANYLKYLLSKDFANYFESGIFQKWQKLDQEMEGLAGCMTYELSQNQSDFFKASKEQKQEAKRRCRELLASDKKSGKEWIKQQLGKIDPVKFKEVKFPLLILCLGNFLAFLVFLFEKFAPVWINEWLLEKYGWIRTLFGRRPRIGLVYPQDFKLRVKRALGIKNRQERVETLENIGHVEETMQDDLEEQEVASDLNQHNDPMKDLRESAACSSQHLEEHEKERLETLLGMIEASDRLVFTDEDLQLLHKSGVIMTDEEAAEMTTNVPSDVPDEQRQDNEVQEFARDSPNRQGNVIEAWVENEQEKDKIEAESQVDRQSPQPGPSRRRIWEDDLGEIFSKVKSSDNDSD